MQIRLPPLALLPLLLILGLGTAHAATENYVIAPGVVAELDDPAERGPYSVKSYTDSLNSTGYHSAIIYYPVGSGPFPATTLTAGFTNEKEDIVWLAQQLASHGIATLVFTPTTTYIADARIWAKGHVAGIATLKRENLRFDSPLQGQLDTDRLGLMGYSLGGAGSVIAANELEGEIKAVVPMNPYLPLTPTTEVPYLFIAGNRDTVAKPARVAQTFAAMSGSAPRAFANINGLDHYGTLTRGNKHKEIGRMATAWMQVYLLNDSRYMTFLNGPELDNLLDEGLVFAKSSDFVFVEGL